MSEHEHQPHRHHRHSKSKRHEKSLVSAFKFEIFIGFLFLLGVFLLFEKMEIKTYLFHGIVGLFQTITHWFNELVAGFVEGIQYFETSDIVGIILILLAIFLLGHRIRQKAIWRFSGLSSCPECGGDLVNVHRTQLQRLTAILFRLKIRRYKCKSCDFDGVRVRSLHSR